MSFIHNCTVCGREIACGCEANPTQNTDINAVERLECRVIALFHLLGQANMGQPYADRYGPWGLREVQDDFANVRALASHPTKAIPASEMRDRLLDALKAPSPVAGDVVKLVRAALFNAMLAHGTNDNTYIAEEDLDALATAALEAIPSVDAGELVERPCGECKETGVAEYIDHMARPCDACHGEGFLKFTANEAGLLDTIASLQSREEAGKRIADKIERQAECLEGYAEKAGHEAKPVPSVFHYQATHFRDYATELRAALNKGASHE